MARCNGQRNGVHGVHTKNDTWDLMELLVGKRLISSKWVYKLKQGQNHVETCKARLVVKD
jgi:hypothetical protein